MVGMAPTGYTEDSALREILICHYGSRTQNNKYLKSFHGDRKNEKKAN